MNFATLLLDINYGNYDFCVASNDEMSILGCFFADDVGCPKKQCGSTYKDWALADKTIRSNPFAYTIGGNATSLEEDDYGTIYLIDATGSNDDEENYIPARIQMTREQFVRLLDDWQEKVCKHKPKEVIIKHVDDHFIIETRD